MREVAVENWVKNNIEKLFPGSTLVGRDEVLADRIEIDLHLRDRDQKDVFVEVKASGLKPRDIGTLLNIYSFLSNLDDTQGMRFIVLLPEINEDDREVLNGFGVETLLLGDLSGEKNVDVSLRGLKNVLTPTESMVLSYINGRKCGVIDVGGLVQAFNIENSNASKILERLERKEYLERIKRGLYLYIPLEYGYEDRFTPMNSLAVGSVLVEPYYFGYQTVNRFHGFTAQFSPVTYICTTKLRRRFKWRSIRYRFVNLVQDKFFGFERRLSDGCEIFVARPEKAVLDSLDKPGYCGGVAQIVAVVANAFVKGLDADRLLGYAARFGSYSVIQRLGYLTDFLRARELVDTSSEFVDAVEKLLPEDTSNTFLGPVGEYGRTGSVNDRWRVIENYPVENLLDEIIVR